MIHGFAAHDMERIDVRIVLEVLAKFAPGSTICPLLFDWCDIVADAGLALEFFLFGAVFAHAHHAGHVAEFAETHVIKSWMRMISR